MPAPTQLLSSMSHAAQKAEQLADAMVDAGLGAAPAMELAADLERIAETLADNYRAQWALAWALDEDGRPVDLLMAALAEALTRVEGHGSKYRALRDLLEVFPELAPSDHRMTGAVSMVAPRPSRGKRPKIVEHQARCAISRLGDLASEIAGRSPRHRWSSDADLDVARRYLVLVLMEFERWVAAIEGRKLPRRPRRCATAEEAKLILANLLEEMAE